MAKQTINIGASPNDGTGTPLRTAFDYTNQNFTELYTATGPSGNNIVVPGNATITGDLTVATNRLSVSSTGVQIGTTTNKTTAFTGNGTGLTIGAALAPTIALWDTTNASYVGSISQIDADMYLTNTAVGQMVFSTDNTSRYTISSTGIATWSNVGGVAGTAMTLNATGLGVGGSPLYKLHAVVTSGAVGAFRASTAAIARLLVGNTVEDVELKVNANGDGQLTAGASKYLGLGSGGLNDRVILDTAGNVGIGVTPSAWGATAKAIQIGSYSGIYNDVDFTVVVNNAFFNGTNNIYRNTAPASQYYQQAGSHVWRTAPSGTAGNTITYTQAMTLDASGNLLVGTTSNTNASRVFARGTGGATTLAVQSSTGDTANPGVLIGKFDNDSTTSQILVRFTINNNAAGSGQITANGANQAAFGSFSDSRLKENILNLPSQLANILSLRPVEFDYKDGSGHQIGFVAQEMQEVYSDAVGEQNGFLTVTGWSKTEARLVSAIKELAAKVQALEAKLA